MMAAAVVLAGCSKDDESADGDDAPPVTSAVEAVDDRCSAAERIEGEIRSDGCADAVFAARIEQAGSEELRDLGRSRQIVIGRTLCSVGAALPAGDSDQKFSDLMSANAESWGVSVGALEEMLLFTEELCPESTGTLQVRHDNDGPMQIDLSASGPGPLEITYTMPDGSTVTDNAVATFTMPIYVEELRDVTLTVEAPDGGDVRCGIDLGGQRVVTETGNAAATCTATSEALRVARSAQSPRG